MKKAIWIIVIILLLAAGGYAAYYFYGPQLIEMAKEYFGSETSVVEEPTPPVIEVTPKQQAPVVTPAKPNVVEPQVMEKPNEMTNELAYFAGEEEQDYLTDTRRVRNSP